MSVHNTDISIRVHNNVIARALGRLKSKVQKADVVKIVQQTGYFASKIFIERRIKVI